MLDVNVFTHNEGEFEILGVDKIEETQSLIIFHRSSGDPTVVIPQAELHHWEFWDSE